MAAPCQLATRTLETADRGPGGSWLFHAHLRCCKICQPNVPPRTLALLRRAVIGEDAAAHYGPALYTRPPGSFGCPGASLATTVAATRPALRLKDPAGANTLRLDVIPDGRGDGTRHSLKAGSDGWMMGWYG